MAENINIHLDENPTGPLILARLVPTTSQNPPELLFPMLSLL